MPSSVIAWYHYDKENSSLLIAFLSGVEYVYKNVPPTVYKEFTNAASKGTYLNKYIKSVFVFDKKEDAVTMQRKRPGKIKKKFKY